MRATHRFPTAYHLDPSSLEDPEEITRLMTTLEPFKGGKHILLIGTGTSGVVCDGCVGGERGRQGAQFQPLFILIAKLNTPSFFLWVIGDRSGLVAGPASTAAGASPGGLGLGGNEKTAAARMREQLQRAARDDLAHLNTCALFLLKVGSGAWMG